MILYGLRSCLRETEMSIVQAGVISVINSCDRLSLF